MIRSLIFAAFVLGLTSCATRKVKSGFEEISDFGLSDDGAGVKVDDKAYFDDLKRSESSVAFESSLPLPLRVGKSGDPFDTIPSLAQPAVESKLFVSIGPCSFNLLTGPVQVDRYLLADKWIKLTEGLPAKTPVKLEPNQDLNIKAVTKVGIEVPEAMRPICRKMFEGRKFTLGRFHLNKSRLGLIAGKGAPSIAFGSRSLDPQGKLIILHWQSGSPTPTVIDDFDFPATSESGIFRAQMSNKGYYYLAFQAIMRMDQVDSMVVKLPYNGTLPKASPAPTPNPSSTVQGARPTPSSGAPSSVAAPSGSTPTKTSPGKGGVPSTVAPVTQSATTSLPMQAGKAATKGGAASAPAKASPGHSGAKGSSGHGVKPTQGTVPKGKAASSPLKKTLTPPPLPKKK